MNTMALTPGAPLPLLSLPLRLAAALAVALLLVLASVSAQHESEQAVHSAIAAFAASHVTLPTVQVTGRRGAADLRSSRAGSALS